MLSARPLLLCVFLLVTPLVPTTPSNEAISAPQADTTPGNNLLKILPGRWQGEQHAGGATLLESVEWDQILRDRFLRCRMKSIDPVTGKVTYEGLGLLHREGSTDRYSLHWFDSEGYVEEYLGRRKEGALEFEGAATSSIRRLVFRPHGKEYTCTATTRNESGAEVPLFETMYHRKSDSQKQPGKQNE